MYFLMNIYRTAKCQNVIRLTQDGTAILDSGNLLWKVNETLFALMQV